MRQTKHGPHHDIFVSDGLVARYGVGDATGLATGLQRVASAGVEFRVLVFRYPEVVLSERGAGGLNAVWVGEEELGSRRDDFEPYGFAGDAVLPVLVDNLENAVIPWLGICKAGLGNGRFNDFVVVSSGVRVRVHGYGEGLFLDDGVVPSIDCGIDAYGENVLMVLREDTRGDDVTIIARLAGVDVDAADNTCSAGLDINAAGLVELVGEDVFVVCEGDDELDNEFAVTGYDGAALGAC